MLQLATENSLYHQDYAYLKKMGDCYKLIKCNEVRRAGLQLSPARMVIEGVWDGGYRHGRFLTKKHICIDTSLTVNEHEALRAHSSEEKLKNNIIRARNKIIEYSLCNDFEYFVTLTLDKQKFNRYDLPEFIKSLGYWIQNLNARTDARIQYLLIPERHADGAWHLHGFLKGIPRRMLRLFDAKGRRKLPPFILKALKSGRQLYDFPAYRERFGYCCLEPVQDKIGATMYMCKYISKDISRNVRELGAHLYYCSKGLKKAEIVAQGQWLDCSFDWDYVHKFGSVSFYNSLDDKTLQYIKDRIGGEPLTLDDYKRGCRKDREGWQLYCDPDTGEIFGEGYKTIEEVMADAEIPDFSVPVPGKPVPDIEKRTVPDKKALAAAAPEARTPSGGVQLELKDFFDTYGFI